MFLDDVRDYLIAQGVASAGWNIFVNYFPSDQDQVIGIFGTGGMPADTLLRENTRPTFQSRLRVGEFAQAAGYAKWLEIFNALQDAKASVGSPYLLPGVTFIQAQATEPLIFNDANRRPNFTSNWRCMKSR